MLSGVDVPQWMRMYSMREAAELTGRKVRTIRQWLRDGKLKAVKSRNGWHWLIPASEIERIMNGNRD